MDLTQFYSLNENIEIHITNADDKMNDQDDWEIIDQDNFLSSDNHKVTIEVPSPRNNFEKHMPKLDDMSILSNQETSIIYDDLLKEKFTDFELEQVLNNAKNEAKMEMLHEQKIRECDFEDQKKGLEKFYEKKIIEGETTIAELNSELEKVQNSLVNTRSELHDQTQLYKILQSEITKLEAVEVKNEAIEAQLSKLKTEKQEIVKERTQLKKDIISLNEKNESLQKEISEVTSQLKESEAIQVVLKNEIESLKATCSEKEDAITEYEDTIKKCKSNLESHKKDYQKQKEILKTEIETWKNGFENQVKEFEKKEKQLVQSNKDLEDLRETMAQDKVEMEEILNKYAEEIEDYNNTIDEQNLDIIKSKKQISDLKTKIEENVALTQKRENEIKDLQEEIENSKFLIADLKNLNVEYTKEIYNLKKEEDTTSLNLQNIQENVEKAKEMYQELEGKYNTQKEENQALQDLVKFK